jgi:hypothetical protein
MESGMPIDKLRSRLDTVDNAVYARAMCREGKKWTTVSAAGLAGHVVERKGDDIAGSEVEQWGEVIDIMEASLEAEGIGTEGCEWDAWRVYVYDEDGKQITTVHGTVGPSKAEVPKGGVSMEDAIGIIATALQGFANSNQSLANANVALLREHTKVVHVYGESLAHRETVMAEAVETMVNARANELAAEAEAFELATVADAAFAEGEGAEPDAKDMAKDLLQTIMAKIGGGNAKINLNKLNWDKVADTVLSDPDLSAKAMSAFTKAQAKRNAPPAEDTPNDGETT